MRALVALDHHFLRGDDGEVYVGHPFAIRGYAFWAPYLEVFDKVRVLGRVRRASGGFSEALRASGPRVTFHDLPDYLGPWQYAREWMRLRARVRQALTDDQALILRVPGAIGQLVWQSLRHSHRPYGLEVVADPWDMYAPGAVPSPVRPIVRRRWSALLRTMCRQAPGVLYVTRNALQRRYPPGPDTWTTYASDVDLRGGIIDAHGLEARMRRLAALFAADGPAAIPQIGFVGALAQMYKAPDVLLRAAALCARSGLKFTLALVGDGKYRPSMETLAAELGIADRVRFLGALPPGEAVRDFLDRVDLFVLPSRQEGLPRAMVEAMARGCPCLGSTVGGIPELLDAEDLVPPDDPDALARKIREVLADRLRLERMMSRNLERAGDFLPDALLERELSFYRKVRDQASEGMITSSKGA